MSDFAVETPAWMADTDEMMVEDNGSVIDGVVDHDFLMMLDDDASLAEDDAALPPSDFLANDDDLNLDLTENDDDDDQIAF